MRIIDKYILRELAIPIFVCLYILVLLFIIADVFDHLSEIITNKTPARDIVLYYLYLLPFSIVQTISWATFLGTMYLFSVFTRHSEIIAMKACGLKITKIVAPIFFLGIIIGVLTFVINDRIVPHTFQKAQTILKEKIEIEPTKNTEKSLIKNTTLLSQQRQFFIKNFNPAIQTMDDIRIHLLDENHLVKEKIVAQKARWNGRSWIFQKVSIYHLDAQGRIVGDPEVYEHKTFPFISEKPADFIEASFDPTYLTSKELESRIKHLKNNGLNVHQEEVALHQKRAFPWQSLVIMLIVIPFLGRTVGNVRRDIIRHFLPCLLLVFVYHIVSAIGLALGSSGVLLPFMSAWIANFILAASGVLLLDRANY